MLGIRMLPASALLAAFTFTAHSSASGATIFLPGNIVNGTIPSAAINAPVRIVATARVPATSPAKVKKPQPDDQVPMMWAMLTGSFALIGMAVRRTKRSPSVTS